MTLCVTPVSASERIYTLDVIRGFALLGIFIMNMPWFTASFYIDYVGDDPWPEWWDQWTQTGTDVLFSGKFNSMFSMLFAVGFILQLERLEARDPARATSIYLRRIFWLFIFGVIHLCVFWNGDVLHIYAVFGPLLLALPEPVSGVRRGWLGGRVHRRLRGLRALRLHHLVHEFQLRKRLR